MRLNNRYNFPTGGIRRRIKKTINLLQVTLLYNCATGRWLIVHCSALHEPKPTNGSWKGRTVLLAHVRFECTGRRMLVSLSLLPLGITDMLNPPLIRVKNEEK